MRKDLPYPSFILSLLMLLPSSMSIGAMRKLHSLSRSSLTCGCSTSNVECGWQNDLVTIAPSLPSTPLDSAAAELSHRGVVRINGVFTPEFCHDLKAHILTLRSGAYSYTDPSSKETDKSFIPGTRLRFTQPVECSFAGARSDILLPLRDEIVAEALQKAVTKLKDVLLDATPTLPMLSFDDLSTTARSSSSHSTCSCPGYPGADGTYSYSDLELIELSALLALPGSKHQMAHHDYKRYRRGDDTPADTAQRIGKMPPRLVTFVYLQSCPTAGHGPTVFLRGTASADAHRRFEMLQGSSPPHKDLTGACIATLDAGDAVRSLMCAFSHRLFSHRLCLFIKKKR